MIELLVVITVIAILAGLVAPMVFSHVGDAKTSAARAQIELFGLGLEAYRLDPRFVDVNMILATLLVQLGMPEAAPYVLADAVTAPSSAARDVNADAHRSRPSIARAEKCKGRIFMGRVSGNGRRG